MPAEAAPDPHTLPLAPEKAVQLEVNGARVATFLCTPRDLDVLAVGCLFLRGVIASGSDVTGIRIEGNAVRVRTLGRRGAPSALPLPRGETFPLASIQEWVRQMFDRADIRRETGGGMHSAGLADRNGLLWFYEDVGRHNAVDKVIGRGLLERCDFSRCCLVCSGRIAVEMAAKAVAAGIPIFASRSIPTTAALEMALEQGLTMIGRVASESPIVYTRGDRLA